MRRKQEFGQGRYFRNDGPPHVSNKIAISKIELTGIFNRFPLFSKSVDTYRFEYGVFLLNKDIEMV